MVMVNKLSKWRHKQIKRWQYVIGCLENKEMSASELSIKMKNDCVLRSSRTFSKLIKEMVSADVVNYRKDGKFIIYFLKN